MNAANESSLAPSLRRPPFSIRLAPQFVNRLSAALPKDHRHNHGLDGLLFGLIETEFAVVQAFRPLAGNFESDSRPAWSSARQEAFELLLTQPKTDLELAGLTLLGWFSYRIVNGLRAEDITFHAKNFGKLNDIAVIITSEPAHERSLDIYCRSLDGTFFEERHRSGTVRISSVSPVLYPIDVPMVPVAPERVLVRGRAADEADEAEEPGIGWKDALASKTRKALDLLKTAKPEHSDENAASDSGIGDVRQEHQDSLRPITPPLAFGSSGGAAPAPAKIPENRPEIPGSLAGVGEEVRLDPESPRIVPAPRARLAARSMEEAVLIRAKEHPLPSDRDQQFSTEVSPPAEAEPPKPEPAKPERRKQMGGGQSR